MAQDILKNCKKYVIQRINNPGSYLIVENENEVYNERKIRRFERLLANDIVRCKSTKKINIGQMVAIKDDTGYHRGKIADVFKRSCKTMYWVLLIDSGKMVETVDENIYLIKNQEFKDKVSNAFEIIIHGVQPAALDINYDNPVSGGIFQKRKCNKWSEGANKFVKNLFMNDSCIFVKIIGCDKITSGEIYYIQDSKVVSLGQSLCDEGFAIFCDATEKFKDNYNQSGTCSKEIEEKIPASALFDDLKLGKTLKKLSISVKNTTNEFKTASLESSLVADCVKNNYLSSSKEKTEIWDSASSFNSSTLFASNKTTVKTTLSSSSDKTPNEEEPTKLNVCRIVLRNLKLFNQQKHITQGHNQN